MKNLTNGPNNDIMALLGQDLDAAQFDLAKAGEKIQKVKSFG